MQQLQQMNPEILIFAVAAIVVVLVLAFVLFRILGRNRGKRDFAGHYGEEYQRLVAETGSREKAEERLTQGSVALPTITCMPWIRRHRNVTRPNGKARRRPLSMIPRHHSRRQARSWTKYCPSRAIQPRISTG